MSTMCIELFRLSKEAVHILNKYNTHVQDVQELATPDGENTIFWDLYIFVKVNGVSKKHHYHREERPDNFIEPYHRWDYRQDYYQERLSNHLAAKQNVNYV